MVHITNTLDTQNLKEHCNGIVNKHPNTESQGALGIVTNTLDTQNIRRDTAMV